MYCPNCAAKNDTEQKFCRSCGMNLEKTAALLAEQFSEGLASDIERAEQRLERFGQFAFGGFAVVLGIAILGILYFIVTKMILSGTQPWAGALLTAFIVFAALTLTYVVLNEDLKEKKKTPAKAQPEMQARETAELERLTDGASMPIPSVTENTTDLLQTENKTRKL